MKNNIDEILKQQFSDFAPDAPNVWPSVEQGIGQAATQVVTQVAVKAGFFTTKVITAIVSVAVVVSAVATYVYLKLDNKNQTIKEKPAVVVEEQASVPVSVIPQEEMQANMADKKENIAEGAKKSIHKTEEKAKQGIAKKELNNKSSASTQHRTLSTPAERRQEQMAERLTKQEATQERTPKPIVKQESSAIERNPKLEGKEETPELSKWQIEEAARLNIPNIFSPNGDQSNDYFVIEIENEELFYLIIFDRNGQEVFESHSKEEMWNGINQRNGALCEEGTYTFTLRYKVKGIDKEQSKTGRLKLTR